MSDPRWRLSGFYFWYYAAVGALSPYFGRWVVESGHGALAASQVMSLWYATRVLAPWLWSWACARAARPLAWLRFGAWACAGSFCGFLVFDTLPGILLTMAVFSFFANAILPQFEALALDRLEHRRERYARVRVWGSVGFVLVAAGYGPLLDHWGGAWLPALMLPLLVLLGLSSQIVGEGRAAPPLPSAPLGLREVLVRAPARRFLCVAFLMQAGFGPFYVFYTLHLARHGHDGQTIGLLWAAGVVAEIVMFLGMSRVFGRWSAQAVIALSVAATALRWAVVALWPGQLVVMLAAQLVHALSFGAFHAASMQRVGQFFPGQLGHAGQSLLYGFSSGLGGVVGALLAGVAFEAGGGFAAFGLAALLCLLALLPARSPD
ncbi:MAG: MFS transporter [Lysobacteraceae bacterium]|nr:MAG: MFS transporter [Xanthomonadaceae bacterium]